VQANVAGTSDDAVFAAAIANDRILLTNNCVDFVDISNKLNARSIQHPGLLLVYLQNDPVRHTSYDMIVQAITNLEATELPLANVTSFASFRLL
jgi:hypothetical protein